MIKQLDFEQLMKLHYPGLQRVAASYEANISLRDELVQDILEAVWLSLKNFRGDASIKTYTFRIAHFRCARHVNKQVKQIESNVEYPLESIDYQYPEDLAEQQQKIEKLMNAVRQLPIIQKQLITLSFEGFTYQELSEMTGLKKNNVGVNLNRAKMKLKQILEQGHA